MASASPVAVAGSTWSGPGTGSLYGPLHGRYVSSGGQRDGDHLSSPSRHGRTGNVSSRCPSFESRTAARGGGSGNKPRSKLRLRDGPNGGWVQAEGDARR